MAITTVQSEAQQFISDSTPTLTPSSAPTENNFYYLCISFNPGTTITSVTTTNVTWTLRDSRTSGGSGHILFVYTGETTGTPGTDIDVVLSGSTNSIIYFMEMSGVDSFNDSETQGTASQFPDTPAVTTNNPINRVIGAFSVNIFGGPSFVQANNSFTVDDSETIVADDRENYFIVKDTTSGSAETPEIEYTSSVSYRAVGISLIGAELEAEGTIAAVGSLSGAASASFSVDGLIEANAGFTGNLTQELGCPQIFPRNTSYKTEAITNFIEQFRSSTNLHNLACSYLEQIQLLEEAFHLILDKFNLQCAVGDQLDILGRIVNENRQGQTDDEFRQAIRTKIRANVSEGTIEDIIAIAKSALNQAGSIEVTEAFPGTAFVRVNGVTLNAIESAQLKKFLVLGSPAGVQIFYIFIPTNSFGLTNVALTDNTGKGFGTTNIFASLI